MNPVRITLLITLVFLYTSAISQNYNPYKSIGKKGKIITAYKEEFLDNHDTLQRIGSVIINTRTKKIVRLLNTNETERKFSNGTTPSRWWGIDNKAEKYMPVSPYVFAGNNPILFKDPDGQDIIPTTSFKNSSYYTVFQKLMTSSKVYKDNLKDYENNKKFNYTLKTTEVNKANPSTIARTPVDAVTTKNGIVTSIEVSTTTFSINDSKTITKDGQSSKMELNDMGKALVLLHESTHAFLHTITGGAIDFADHQEMARSAGGQSYQADIFQGLKDFASASGMEMTTELTKNLEDLSFYGLQGTAEFNKRFGITGTDEQKATKTKEVIDKLDALIYTIKPKS